MAHYNAIAGQRLGRMEALADGAFAIALTLLVLDIRVPWSQAAGADADALAVIVGIPPAFLTYFLSFPTLGIFWIGRSTQFDFAVRTDRKQT